MPGKTFPKIQTSGDLSRVQDNLLKAIGNLATSPTADSLMLTNQALLAGANVLSHGLGRNLVGYSVMPHSTVAPTGWIPFSSAMYGTHMADYNVVNSTTPNQYVVPAYRMGADGRVYLQGLMASTSGQTIAAGATVATMPAGFTPSASTLYGPIFTCYGGYGADGNSICRVDIYFSGAVIFASAKTTASSPSALTFLSLEGIAFQSAAAVTPTFSDSQASNQTPDKTLILNSTAAVSADILVW